MDNKRGGAILGICLFAAGCTSGTNDAGTASAVAGQPASGVSQSAGSPPSATAPVSPTSGQNSTTEIPALFAEAGEVAPGTYRTDLVGTPVEVTVPAGWTRYEDWSLVGPDDSYLAFMDVEDTYKDACDWSKGKAGIGATVQDLVAGLRAVKGLQSTEPQPLTIGDVTGVQLVTTPDPKIKNFANCYLGDFAVWTITNNRQVGKQAPTEATTTWILNLDGRRGVITTGSPGPMSAATKAQVQEMLASLKFG